MLPVTRFLPILKNITNTKHIHSSIINLEKFQNPIWRTINILRNDLRWNREPTQNTNQLMGIFPSHVDVLVIGGGAIGSSIAYWLKEKTGLTGIRVAVLEKDPTVRILDIYM